MTLRVISYGGGVQSTALVVLATQGKIGQFILDSRAEGRSVRWIQDHLQTEVSDALDAQDGAPQWG